MPYVASNEGTEVAEAAALVRDLELCELLGGLLRHAFRQCADLDVKLAGRSIVATCVLGTDGMAREITVPVLAAKSPEIALIDAFACLESKLADLTGKRAGTALSARLDRAHAAGNVVPFPKAPRRTGQQPGVPGQIARQIATTSDQMNASLRQVATLLEELAASGAVAPALLVGLTERVQTLNNAAASFASKAAATLSPDGET